MNRSKKFCQFFFVILLTSLTYACGFELRGALELSDNLSPVYIKQNSAFDLAREIEVLLDNNKISIAEKIGQSNVQLVLKKESKKRRILSVDSDGRAREYLLTYKVTFSFHQDRNLADTDKLAQSITLTRSLLFDPNAVLAITNESEILYKEMRRDAARTILLKLQASSHGKAQGQADKK